MNARSGPAAEASPPTTGRDGSHGRRRRRRWLRPLGIGTAVLITVFVVAVGVLLAAVPGVANAQSLVRRHLAAHGGRAVQAPPPKVAASLVAIEDHAFYDPPGVDIAYGVTRLAFAGIRGSGSGGGSTLAQQLAKNLYTGPGQGLLGEVEQVGLALKMELSYSHAELLTMYLDDAYFGNGAYGVAQAAHRYFHRPPAGLDWAQAAMLAGLMQAPSAYDPLRHPVAARRRREAVLDQLGEVGDLTTSGEAVAAAMPLVATGT